MSRRKYKKTKRKMSRKTIHKTRRRTKNRVKKLSKNQSGGVTELGSEIKTEIESSIDDAMIPLAGNKRGRSSMSDTPSTKRTKPTLPDEELGKLIINSLFKKVTNVSFIQDSSRYAFILYATVPDRILFDTKYLPLSEVLDITTPDRGISLQHFCMKISLVLNVTDAKMVQNYEYIDNRGEPHSKRAVSVIRSTKEAHIQKKLYDSFACMNGTSPFVPDVIAHGVFNHDSLESYISSFKANRRAAASETGTAAEIDRRVLHVLSEISGWLQQKNLNNSRETDASKKQNWAVDILLMDYIDTTEYKTLYTLGTTTGLFDSGNTTFNPSKIQKALLTTAAQLACATGVGIILYDCHPNNALSDKSHSRVVLIDIGSAIDYINTFDKQFILQTFGTMLGILSGGNPYCSIEQLCAFFGVGITAAISTTGKQGKQKPNILTQKFKENLDNLVDFRCGEITIEHIHHNLIMTAFVDFMMYIVVHNRNQCQSKYTMESVYGVDTFSDFSAFLTRFRPNDRTFRSSGTPPDSYNAKLGAVNQEISKIVRLCSSVKCPVDPVKLIKSSWSLLSSSATLPPQKRARASSLAGQSPEAEAQEGPHKRGCLIM
jgi:hypothetical protein